MANSLRGGFGSAIPGMPKASRLEEPARRLQICDQHYRRLSAAGGRASAEALDLRFSPKDEDGDVQEPARRLQIRDVVVVLKGLRGGFQPAI